MEAKLEVFHLTSKENTIVNIYTEINYEHII